MTPKLPTPKIILSAAEILEQAQAHAQGGPKPAWAGQTVHVGSLAAEDWAHIDSETETPKPPAPPPPPPLPSEEWPG